MMDREVDRTGDEAQFLGVVVQGFGALSHRRVGDGDSGAEQDPAELTAAVRVLVHGAEGSIGVRGHDDPGAGGEVQVRQHVALGQGGHEKLLGVPALRIAPEGGVGGTGDGWFADGTDLVFAPVRAVAARARAGVASPLQRDLVGMRGVHGCIVGTVPRGTALLAAARPLRDVWPLLPGAALRQPAARRLPPAVQSPRPQER